MNRIVICKTLLQSWKSFGKDVDKTSSSVLLLFFFRQHKLPEEVEVLYILQYVKICCKQKVGLLFSVSP